MRQLNIQKVIFLLLFYLCANTSFANHKGYRVTLPSVAFTDLLNYETAEGYHVSITGDTSFTTFTIPTYLDEPYYPMLQWRVKCKKTDHTVQKLNPKSTKSFAFKFRNKVIVMIPCKIKTGNFFLKLENKKDLQLPDGKFEIFTYYRFSKPILSALEKVPLTKDYVIKITDQKVIIFTENNFNKKLTRHLTKNSQ